MHYEAGYPAGSGPKLLDHLLKDARESWIGTTERVFELWPTTGAAYPLGAIPTAWIAAEQCSRSTAASLREWVGQRP